MNNEAKPRGEDNSGECHLGETHRWFYHTPKYGNDNWARVCYDCQMEQTLQLVRRWETDEETAARQAWEGGYNG